MSLPKMLFFSALILFGSIGLIAMWKGKPVRTEQAASPVEYPQQLSTHSANQITTPLHIALNEQAEVFPEAEEPEIDPSRTPEHAFQMPSIPERPVPEVDNMYRFFILDSKQFPIVETISYKAQVPWVVGRPAWVADYASHFRTSRHFIARSLNGKADYIKQNVAEGDRFNVLKSNKNIAFYLVVDIFRCKMWFYYVDVDAKEKVLVKTYSVGLGRWDPSTGSGLLTPLGVYKLGDRTGVYTAKSKGIYNGQEIPMSSVFGTRWIPFEQEVSGCTAPAKGLGIHGCPWTTSPNGHFSEDTSGISHHTSDGCIRLATSDVEELFAVIVSRPTTVILVSDFFDAEVPGVERTPLALPNIGFGKE